MSDNSIYLHPCTFHFDLQRCLSPMPVVSNEVVAARTLNGTTYPSLRQALEGALKELKTMLSGGMTFKGTVAAQSGLAQSYTGNAGDFFYCTGNGVYYAWNGSAWSEGGNAAKLADGCVSPQKTSFITGTGYPDLMEGVEIMTDKQLNNIGGADDSVGFDTNLNGIPVIPGQTYCFSVNGEAVYIDKIVFKTADNITATDWDEVNGTYISNHTAVYKNITAPETAKYMFLSFSRGDIVLADLVVQQAEEPQPVGDNFTLSRYISVPQSVSSNLFGKKMMTLGDSLSEEGKWQEHVKQTLGLSEIKNLAVGGTKINVFANAVNSQNIADMDVVFVMGLFNSTGSAPGSPADAASNAENASVCAGYKYIVEKLYSLKPDVHIVLASPHRPAANDVGEKANAVGMVAAYYGIPFIDVYNEAGFNTLTSSHFLRDGIHSTDDGYAREAEVIAGGLLRYFG